MASLVETAMRNVMKHPITNEDYLRIRKLVDMLPDGMQTSPATIYDIVLRYEHERTMDGLIRQASYDAQNRIAQDMPERVEKAAERALNHLRDRLPIDAADRFGRLLKWGVVWTVFVCMVAGIAGWMLSGWIIERPEKSRHAAIETEFVRCTDAATGALLNSARRGQRAPPVESEVVRTDLLVCAAEYADRRAGNR